MKYEQHFIILRNFYKINSSRPHDLADKAQDGKPPYNLWQNRVPIIIIIII
jgi:hypothetical protein